MTTPNILGKSPKSARWMWQEHIWGWLELIDPRHVHVAIWLKAWSITSTGKKHQAVWLWVVPGWLFYMVSTYTWYSRRTPWGSSTSRPVEFIIWSCTVKHGIGRISTLREISIQPGTVLHLVDAQLDHKNEDLTMNVYIVQGTQHFSSYWTWGN